jgi:hypothetical protein
VCWNCLPTPLDAAKTAGLVRADVQLDDLPIIFAILPSSVEEAAASGRPDVALRLLELVFQGIAQRSWRPRPGRPPSCRPSISIVPLPVEIMRRAGGAT